MNKKLLDKVVSLHTEIDNVGKKIEAIEFAESTLLLEGIDVDKDAISFIREKYEANLADLQAELNKYDIVNSVPLAGVNPSDNPRLKWAKYVATNKDGEICALEALPVRINKWWYPQSLTLFESITHEQAIKLCGRVPQWEDDEPTPVINK